MKRTVSIFIVFIMLFSFSFATVTETRSYILKTVTNPKVSSTSGEWAVLGVTRYEKNKDFANSYYKNLCNTLKDKKGVLSDTKYTEYARVVIALSSIGKNPYNVNGYNLIAKLCDTDKVKNQGINGAIFALIALDTRNYKVNENVREEYIKYILNKEISGGGFSLTGEKPDIDVTSMAICALYKYRSDEKVNAVIQRAVKVLKLSKATYVESIAQEIVALCSLNDANNKDYINTLVTSLSAYKLSDGSYKHSINDETSNLMSTEQVLYALVAYDRFTNNKKFLYDMTDVEIELDTLRVLLKSFLPILY
ncbi:MAG: hypothetical protein IJS47_02080 [Clostridia bacterium]|nr:hypothetical protein [Clostridia bacterium]